MKSRLLEILENNGTGVLKGVFRSCVHLERVNLSDVTTVVFSKNEIPLGAHQLKLFEIFLVGEAEKIFHFKLVNNLEKPNCYEVPGFPSGGNNVSIFLELFSPNIGDIGNFYARFPARSLITLSDFF